MATKKRKVPIKLTLSFDDAYKAYEKGKNTAQEPALLKKLFAAKRAIERAQEGPYDHKKVRPSTAGQRREAGKLFGRQEETVEHQGRLQRIPGSVVGPNERHKRVTQEDKRRAAKTFSTGVEIASYAIGAGQMIGLIKGAITIGAKFLTKEAVKKTGKKRAVQLANAATRRANRQAADVTKAAKTRTATATMTKAEKAAKAAKAQKAKVAREESAKTAPKTVAKKADVKKADAKKAAPIVKPAAGKPKKPVSAAQRKLDDQARRTARANQQKAAAPKKAAPKKAAAKAGLTSAEKLAMASLVAGTGTAVAIDYEIAKRQARDITDATTRREVLADIASAEKAAKAVKAKYDKKYPELLIPERKRIDKVKVPADIEDRKDEMGAKGADKELPEDISWKKGHDPVTKFMEELIGTKRTAAQIKKDMAAERYSGSEDEMLEFYGKKRGGKVTAKRPSTKKYAMNRGGMASLRKPTRA